MLAKIKVEKEVEIKTLLVKAGVRYWEDSEINGEPDSELGEKIPCKDGSLWCPEINVDTGEILNWTKGVKAAIHYKVCDAGSYFLKDDKGEIVISQEDGYVPACLSPSGDGYGDYMIMLVDENGFISGWDFDISDFQNEEE